MSFDICSMSKMRRKNKMLYLLKLWTDQKLNYATLHPNIAQYVREKYITLYILLVLIG